MTMIALIAIGVILLPVAFLVTFLIVFVIAVIRQESTHLKGALAIVVILSVWAVMFIPFILHYTG